MANKRSQRWIYIIGGIIAFIVLSPVALCGIMLAPTLYDIALNVIPWPTPQAMSLTYLPLPNAAITTGPAVTPDWDNDEDLFSRSLNSHVVLYTNRFRTEWFTDEHFYLTIRVVDAQYGPSPARLSQGGNIQGRSWGYGILFPWPMEPFTEQVIYAIDEPMRGMGLYLSSHDAAGSASAQFIEWRLDPPTASGEADPLATCNHQVRGHITLTSYSPVVGNFQFACQFDATEYALVSGWFWE